MTRKLAATTPHTTADAERWYGEQMGAKKLEHQKRLADAEQGRCTCEPVKVRRRWSDEPDSLKVRTVHDADCAKWKPWMEEVRPRG